MAQSPVSLGGCVLPFALELEMLFVLLFSAVVNILIFHPVLVFGHALLFPETYSAEFSSVVSHFLPSHHSSSSESGCHSSLYSDPRSPSFLFLFFFEIGFYYAAQVMLAFTFTLPQPPESQITGLCHHARLQLLFKVN